MPCPAQEVIHLNLRGRRPHALVQDDEDWRVLSTIARRTLFWCGGWIHGCRCQGREMRFAIEMAGASVGAIAHHMADAYAIYLRRRRGWTGRIFHHYVAVPVDAELFLDDLVIWLHRPADKSEGTQSDIFWTADSAYLNPKSATWITTERVLFALSPGGAGRSAYIRRKTQPIAPEVMAILTGRRVRRQGRGEVRPRHATLRGQAREQPNIEKIARFVAELNQLSYEDMQSGSRRRAVSKAKAVATVLCTRHGASVAAVARLFGRSRSTLIEQVERYRETQPRLFAQAERMFEASPEGHAADGTIGLPTANSVRSWCRASRRHGDPMESRARGIEDGVASFSKR